MPMQPSPAGGNRSHPSSAAAAASSSSSPADLKKKAITCLNKLSDRDTFAMASAELEKMAVSLSPDCYAPFLSCIYHTDASHKSPVRRQCVRLLTTLARTHANRLAPVLPKMLLSILRRLRDADSSVRSACVDAVSAAASSVTRPPFSASFLKPLADAILLDQDLHLQTGAALCLSAAVDASPAVDPAHLQRLLPRFLKLLRSDAFKAKSALLSAVASIVRAGGARSPNLLALLIPALVDLLGSDDWAARKAAAEALLSVADAERDLVGDFKDACLLQFEARRFDKVKAARDSMNRMIEAWNQVHGGVPSNDDNSHPDQSNSSSRENAGDGPFPRTCKNSNSAAGLESAASEQNKKTSVAKRSTSPLLYPNKASRKKSASDWKIEIAVPQEPGSKIMREDNIQTGKGRNLQSKVEVKRALFDNDSDEKKKQKFGGLKSHSRVVPLQEKESTGSTAAVANATEETYAAQKDGGDLSLIRKQLVQIENQQASLLDMLQKFIGSSQSGMRSLETRVRGLEIALDEISHDLAASAARMSNCDRADSAATCCRLPGADFLSSKFWRRNIVVGRYSNSRFSTSVGAPSFLGNNLDRGRFKNPGGFVVNPLAEVHSQSRDAELTTGPNKQF